MKSINCSSLIVTELWKGWFTVNAFSGAGRNVQMTPCDSGLQETLMSWCCHSPAPPLLPVPYPNRMCNFGSAAVPPRLVNLETQQTGAPSAWTAALPAVPDSFAWVIRESAVLSSRASAGHICVWRCEQKLLIWAVLLVVGRGSRGQAADRHAGVSCSFTFGP